MHKIEKREAIHLSDRLCLLVLFSVSPGHPSLLICLRALCWWYIACGQAVTNVSNAAFQVCVCVRVCGCFFFFFRFLPVCVL